MSASPSPQPADVAKPYKKSTRILFTAWIIPIIFSQCIQIESQVGFLIKIIEQKETVSTTRSQTHKHARTRVYAKYR